MNKNWTQSTNLSNKHNKIVEECRANRSKVYLYKPARRIQHHWARIDEILQRIQASNTITTGSIDRSRSKSKMKWRSRKKMLFRAMISLLKGHTSTRNPIGCYQQWKATADISGMLCYFVSILDALDEFLPFILKLLHMESLFWWNILIDEHRKKISIRIYLHQIFYAEHRSIFAFF